MVICAICQFEITVGYTPLGCGFHGFHLHCLHDWTNTSDNQWRSRVTCPLCRQGNCRVSFAWRAPPPSPPIIPPPPPPVVSQSPQPGPSHASPSLHASPQPGPSRSGPSWQSSPQPGPSRPGPSWQSSPQPGPSHTARPIQGPPQGSLEPLHKTCHICGKPCNNSSHKSRHLVTHSGPYICEECNVSCARPDILQRHMNRKHPPPPQ